MRKWIPILVVCLWVSGCMNSGSAFNDAPDTKSARSEPPSAAAADHAIADPSLNTVNDTNTIKQSGASRTPTG